MLAVRIICVGLTSKKTKEKCAKFSQVKSRRGVINVLWGVKSTWKSIGNMGDFELTHRISKWIPKQSVLKYSSEC